LNGGWGMDDGRWEEEGSKPDGLFYSGEDATFVNCFRRGLVCSGFLCRFYDTNDCDGEGVLD
jgi:hypothetical protein